MSALSRNETAKTVVLKILCGILKPTSGTAKANGFDVIKDPEKIHRIIDFCQQEPAYYCYLSGQDNIEIFGTFHGIEPKLLRERTTQEEELTY